MCVLYPLLYLNFVQQPYDLPINLAPLHFGTSTQS